MILMWKLRSQGFDCENSRFHEIFTVEFVDEDGSVFLEKSAWMLILGLAAMDNMRLASKERSDEGSLVE